MFLNYAQFLIDIRENFDRIEQILLSGLELYPEYGINKLKNFIFR
jgi:hypothetical protein